MSGGRQRVTAVVKQLTQRRAIARATRVLAVHRIERLVQEQADRARDVDPGRQGALHEPAALVPHDQHVRKHVEEQADECDHVGRHPQRQPFGARKPKAVQGVVQRGVRARFVLVKRDVHQALGGQAPDVEQARRRGGSGLGDGGIHRIGQTTLNCIFLLTRKIDYNRL